MRLNKCSITAIITFTGWAIWINCPTVRHRGDRFVMVESGCCESSQTPGAVTGCLPLSLDQGSPVATYTQCSARESSNHHVPHQPQPRPRLGHLNLNLTWPRLRRLTRPEDVERRLGNEDNKVLDVDICDRKCVASLPWRQSGLLGEESRLLQHASQLWCLSSPGKEIYKEVIKADKD